MIGGDSVDLLHDRVDYLLIRPWNDASLRGTPILQLYCFERTRWKLVARLNNKTGAELALGFLHSCIDTAPYHETHRKAERQHKQQYQ